MWSQIPGPPIAFARPGVTPSGKRYNPAGYKDWKERAVEQMRLVDRVTRLGNIPVSVMIEVHSNFLGLSIVPISGHRIVRPKGIRGDLDNYVKAALDAAQDAKWIADDRQVVNIVASMIGEEGDTP